MATKEQSIVLVTGANGGIGFEIAAQLLADASKFVLLGSRSLEKGQAAVTQLQERKLPGTVELLQIDVDSETSIVQAAKVVEDKHGRLDALVNNAAITGEEPATDSLSKRLTATFRTNATGPAVVVETFAPLLAKSEKTVRIVNITSGAGSISLRLDYSNERQKMKFLPYRLSKSALNMLTACQAHEYGPLGWKVVAFCPGYTESNLSTMNRVVNGAKPTAEGARPVIAILAGERDEEHGGFLKEGGMWPW